MSEEKINAIYKTKVNLEEMAVNEMDITLPPVAFLKNLYGEVCQLQE